MPSIKEENTWVRDPEPPPPPLFVLDGEEISPFDIEVSDFKFIQRGMKYGKGLRFTTTWRFVHPEHGILGASMEGCMIMKTSAGGFRFSPPISRFGPSQSKQLCVITTDFANLVLRIVRDHKTKGGVSYLDYVGSEDASHLRALDPSEIDAELPGAIRLGEEEEKDGK